MNTQILQTLQNIEKQYDPNDVAHVKDLLFIVVQNINILQNDDEEINAQIGRLLDITFNSQPNPNMHSSFGRHCKCNMNNKAEKILHKVTCLNRIRR